MTKYIPPQMTDKEWIESDPVGMREMVEDKIAELEEDVRLLDDEIMEAYQTYFRRKNKGEDEVERWLYTLAKVDLFLEKKLKDKRKKLRYFYGLRSLLDDRDNPDWITESDIERARQFPLEQLLPELRVAGSSKKKCCCPFHEERTPSFVFYEDTNSYHCFGCQESGDPISFVMKSEGLSFIEAVRRLQ